MMKSFTVVTGLLFLLSAYSWANTLVNDKTGWKTIHNKNGWSIQYPKDWLNGEESDNFAEGRSPKGASSDFESVVIRSPVVQPKEQAAWIEIRVQSSKRFVNLNPNHDKQSTKVVTEPASSTIKNLKTIIEKDSVAGTLLSAEDGHDVNISGNIGYDEVVTHKYFSDGRDNVDSIRIIKVLKIPEHNKTFTIKYHEGDNLGSNELKRNAWKFEKIFDQILVTFVINNK